MEEKTNMITRVLGVIRTILICALAIGILVAAILFAMNKSPQKSLFGYRYYTVLTPSMEPTYKVGDLVFVKLTHAEDISIGDVITFNPSSETDAYLTHRVTTKYENYQGSGVTCFKTKGDANKDEDGFTIDEARVIGKVAFSIPKLGYIIRFIQLRWYFIVPLVILLFVLFKLLDLYAESKNEEEAEHQSSEEKCGESEVHSEDTDDNPTK